MAQRRKQKKSATKKTPARKRPAPKRKTSRKASRKPQITGVMVRVAPELDGRLRMLATNMGKSMEDLIAQALGEFTETWEEHLRTIAALKDDEDRVQLRTPKE
jgi:predicted transcriptional regulator